MNTEMKTPFTVVNSNGTFPDTFLVSIAGGQYADMGGLDLVRCREEGESDSAFWDRAIDGIGSLLRPIHGKLPQKHVVIVTCLYESSSFNPAPSFPDTTFQP